MRTVLYAMAGMMGTLFLISVLLIVGAIDMNGVVVLTMLTGVVWSGVILFFADSFWNVNSHK
jgi:hypothetical protein